MWVKRLAQCLAELPPPPTDAGCLLPLPLSQGFLLTAFPLSLKSCTRETDTRPSQRTAFT